MIARSYDHMNIRKSSYDIFSNLAEEDREPFLLFAKSVTRASWADTRLYFERGPKLIESIIESPIKGPKGNIEFLLTAKYQK